MARRRKQEVPSVAMVEALQQTMSIEDASKLAGCSGALISTRSKTDAQVLHAIEEQGRTRENAIATAIVKHRGNLSKIATELGFASRQSVRYHIVRSPVLKMVFEESRERVVDNAEDNVFAAVETGNLNYSWKLLQTLGKDRGYTERREIEASVTHNVDLASTGRLVGILNQLASNNPVAIEAEFEELSSEDQKLLSSALERQSETESEPA